ncbi:MAG: TolC family protein, partial [Deltaproteobacteria bacterium]|nr:TolC family protein [Deltaproteobacteria bacterium]
MRWLPCMVAVSAIGCVAGSTSRRIDETFEFARTQAPGGARESADRRESEDLSGPVTLQAILSRIVARDPGLGARAHRVRAALHGARAEGSLPPPEVNAQVWNLPLASPYALGEAEMYMLEVRQSFPAAGSLDARARAAVEEARAMTAELASREQELVERASRTYADYVRGTLDRRLRASYLELLAGMLDAARARFATGGVSLADVTRVEVEQARTRRVIARDDGEVARARATLNALLLRPSDAPLGPPADVAPRTIRLPLDALLAQAARTQGGQAQARARAL